MSDFTTKTLIKKTRKPHKCFGCSGTIEVGSSAEMTSGCYDGHMHKTYWCKVCCAVMETMYSFDLEDMSEGSVKDRNENQWYQTKTEMEFDA